MWLTKNMGEKKRGKRGLGQKKNAPPKKLMDINKVRLVSIIHIIPPSSFNNKFTILR